MSGEAVTMDWELISAPAPETSPRQVTDSLTALDKSVGPPVTAIQADLLIPGRGKPLHNQLVIAEGGKIVYVGARSKAPSKYRDVKSKHVPVLMPGMWECHSHFMGLSPSKAINMVNLTFASPAEAGARNARALKETLYAGFTSCIELGGYACELQKVIAENSILGPTLYGAGGAISMTAGHGDSFELPLGCVWAKCSVGQAEGTERGSSVCLIADGVDEARKAVRVNLRRGAKIIKVLTSGGVTSLSDNPKYQQFSDEELKTIVDEAGRMGLVCAAHAIGKAGIMGAIRAGFKVIEHNSEGDDEVFEAMKKNGITGVHTITPVQSILDHEADYPPEMFRKTKLIAERHKQSYRDAIKAGVKLALGSDLFGGVGSVLGPGMNGLEVKYAHELGMTELQAIEAATVNGAESLGKEQAPKSGIIAVGYDADFLGLEKNPLDDIEVLSRPKEIPFIWKGGKLLKAPGLDPWDALGSIAVSACIE